MITAENILNHPGMVKVLGYTFSPSPLALTHPLLTISPFSIRITGTDIVVDSIIPLDELKAFVKTIEYTFRCRANWERRKDFILVLFCSKIAGLFSRKIKTIDVLASEVGNGPVGGSISMDTPHQGATLDSVVRKDTIGTNDSSSNSSISNSSNNDGISPIGVDNNSISSDSSRIGTNNSAQPTPKTAMMAVFESKDMVTSILRFI